MSAPRKPRATPEQIHALRQIAGGSIFGIGTGIRRTIARHGWATTRDPMRRDWYVTDEGLAEIARALPGHAPRGNA